MDENSNHTKNKNSKIFLTIEPEKRAVRWLTGFDSIKNTGHIFKEFQENMLHGDEKHSEYTENFSQQKKKRLGKRLSIEGVIYIFLAFLLGMGSFFSSFEDFNSKDFNGSVFWLVIGFIAVLVGSWIGLIKFWQKYNVETSEHIDLKTFVKHHF